MSIGEVVRKTNFLFESVWFIANWFTCLVFSQIIGPEIPLLIMSGFEPCHHGMMIGLFHNVFVSPFSISGIENIEGFVIFFERVLVVTELESVIIISSNFFNAKIFCLSESQDFALITFLVEEVMFDAFKFVSFQIEDGDARAILFSSFRAQVELAPCF